MSLSSGSERFIKRSCQFNRVIDVNAEASGIEKINFLVPVINRVMNIFIYINFYR